MPIMKCIRDGKPGFKYGESGHCYVYTPGDADSRDYAKAQAEKQMKAIKASQARSNK